MAVGLRSRFESVKEKIRLHGDEAQHEQTDQWSNRDLIPLPPGRRTWGKFVKCSREHDLCSQCDQGGSITSVSGLYRR